MSPGRTLQQVYFGLASMLILHDPAEAALPQRLASMDRLGPEMVGNAAHPRTFRIGMSRMHWTFNGRSDQMGDVALDEVVKLGTAEVWEFDSKRMMAHAIHVHGLQFQVLERFDGPKTDGVLAGSVDSGWDDTVLVTPGERVRLIMRFADFTGPTRTSATCWNTRPMG